MGQVLETSSSDQAEMLRHATSLASHTLLYRHLTSAKAEMVRKMGVKEPTIGEVSRPLSIDKVKSTVLGCHKRILSTSQKRTGVTSVNDSLALSASGTASLNHKESSFTESFMNMMYRDNSLAAGTRFKHACQTI